MYEDTFNDGNNSNHDGYDDDDDIRFGLTQSKNKYQSKVDAETLTPKQKLAFNKLKKADEEAAKLG